jgi:DNA-binding SARP family transcriptional activator
VRIQLLGEVGAVTDRGRPVDVGPAKCQALLAALALSAGRPVPVWRLAELVWGDHPPRTAARTLQSYVAHLRKALGPGAISRASGGYRLDVPADAVDALRFQRLLDSGQTRWTSEPGPTRPRPSGR